MTDNDLQPDEESQPPQEKGPKKYPKAMRVQRVAAVLLDYFIVGLVLTPFSLALDLSSYVESNEMIPVTVVVQFHIGMFIAYVAVNGWWIYRYGQTIGKRILKIAIATEDFQIPPFNRVILIRHLPFAVSWVVPGLILVNIIDWLMVLRDDRRCLHDILAGTQVIDVSQAG